MLKWEVQLSDIHGNGVFASTDIQIGESCGLAIPMIQDSEQSRTFQRNTFGLLINDSTSPNVSTTKVGDDWHFVASRFISKGQEILVSYADYELKIDQETIATQKKVSVI